MIDSHCHLFKEYYADPDIIIHEAGNSNISSLIVSGVNMITNKEVLTLVNHHKNVYATLGIHPEYADKYHQSDLEFIKQNLENKKVIAIGEIGLDYHYQNYDKKSQIQLFEEQLKLAEQNKIPVVIHSRDATLDTLTILKNFKVTGVIHSFTGSIESAREFIKLGFKLGINGVVTFKNAHIKEVVNELGIENFLLETDSPYLTPEPCRGKQNTPEHLKYIVAFLEKYLNMNYNEIIRITDKNVTDIFKKIKQ